MEEKKVWNFKEASDMKTRLIKEGKILVFNGGYCVETIHGKKYVKGEDYFTISNGFIKIIPKDEIKQVANI